MLKLTAGFLSPRSPTFCLDFATKTCRARPMTPSCCVGVEPCAKLRHSPDNYGLTTWLPSRLPRTSCARTRQAGLVGNLRVGYAHGVESEVTASHHLLTARLRAEAVVVARRLIFPFACANTDAAYAFRAPPISARCCSAASSVHFSGEHLDRC